MRRGILFAEAAERVSIMLSKILNLTQNNHGQHHGPLCTHGKQRQMTKPTTTQMTRADM